MGRKKIDTNKPLDPGKRGVTYPNRLRGLLRKGKGCVAERVFLLAHHCPKRQHFQRGVCLLDRIGSYD